MIRRKLFFAFLLLLAGIRAEATHNRAGEITYAQLSALTFQITVTTYTYTPSLADRPTLEVSWGDNSSSFASRIEKISLPNFYQKNVYKINHTYPGPGVYKVVVQDPNRNFGVKNIPNSVNVVFSIQTILTVNPAMGLNQTPELLNPPYDKAAKGYIFIHNPAAFDLDGDSLSYKLTICTREDGKPIENYTFPPATNVFYVDSISGDLVWDTPADTGTYNVAMEIQEWRNGKKIGVVIRDMQIDVFNTNNKPPVNEPLEDMCVEAGDVIDFLFITNDPDGDMIGQKATSGVFMIPGCNAEFIRLDSIPGRSISRFRWETCHTAVRQQPYDVVFKSEDRNAELSLVDIDNMKIKVLGPAPVLLNAAPEGKFIRLTWQPYVSNFISGFAIYRREGASTFSPDSCTNGIPGSEGFIKVGYVPGSASTFFVDSDNGEGLEFGTEYTYRVLAVYPNGTESKASNEISSSLVSGVPIIRNVSVLNTDLSSGSIKLVWKKPDKLDTIPTVTGPYEYIIERATGIDGTNFGFVTSIQTADLNDTTYTDISVNTLSNGYIYKIELYNDGATRFLIGDPGIASSIYLAAAPGDEKVRFTINRNVPWINTRYDFFRLNQTTMVYDSIGTTNQLEWADTGLINGAQYCYKVRSIGGYLQDGMPKNLINFSQEICATPVDNEPPCPPEINVASMCDDNYNYITWTVNDPLCFEDVDGYRLYYKANFEEPFILLSDIDDKNRFYYRHDITSGLVAGCYAIEAYDAIGNVGDLSTVVCVDSCDFYEIPNVFTPNNDNSNDRLIARTSGLVEKVDFKLFNRNGQLIFSTTEPRLNWDGTYNGKVVSPGIYFYQCDVFENRITGLEQFHLSGFVHVITEKGVTVNPLPTKKKLP